MYEIVLLTIITVSATAILAAVILYFVAQRFKVFEDPRIDLVVEVLPGANCGGCGYAGCRNFAEACIKAESLDKLFCPVGGNDCTQKVATILGKVAAEKDPTIAVVRCSGSPDHRQRINTYDGVSNCTIAASLYAGETGCQYGCLGLGDCVSVCKFDAISINPQTALPEVIDNSCTGCGACVTACPRDIIELRKKQKNDRKIFVSCVNKDKGAAAKNFCEVACIGCTKCVKECKFDAITIENFLAYIDPEKCKLCRKCVEVCPTGAILEINFPPRKNKPVETTKETDKQPAEKGKKQEPTTVLSDETDITKNT